MRSHSLVQVPQHRITQTGLEGREADHPLQAPSRTIAVSERESLRTDGAVISTVVVPAKSLARNSLSIATRIFIRRRSMDTTAVVQDPADTQAAEAYDKIH